MIRLPDRLPSMDGRRGAVARALYAVLAVLVAAGTVASLAEAIPANFRDAPAVTRYGLALTGDAAMRAGISPGARIVAVDGVAVAAGGPVTATAARFVGKTGPVTVDAASAGGRTVRNVLAPLPSPAGESDLATGFPAIATAWIHTLEPLATALILAGISLILVLRRSRDPEALLLSFSFLILSFFALDTGWQWRLLAVIPPATLGWANAMILTVGFWAMLVGIVAFPEGRFDSAWARWAWLVPTAYTIGNGATGFVMWVKAPLLTAALNLPIFACVIGPLLLRLRRLKPGVQRQQIKWALYAGALMILAIVIRLALHNPTVDSAVGPGGVYLMSRAEQDIVLVAFPIGILVSLLRFRLYDADVVITRSTVYAVLALALVAVFACTEKLAELLSEKYFGQSLGTLAAGLSAAVSAITIVPLHHRITHWAEHRFRRDLLHLRQRVPSLAATLWEAARPEEIAQATLERTVHALHAPQGAVVTEQGRVLATHGLAQDDAAAIADLPMQTPLAVEGVGPVGRLALSARPDGSLYGADERDALAEIAEPVAQALAAALRREAAQAEDREEKAIVSRRLSALEDAVMALLARPAGPS